MQPETDRYFFPGITMLFKRLQDATIPLTSVLKLEISEKTT